MKHLSLALFAAFSLTHFTHAASPEIETIGGFPVSSGTIPIALEVPAGKSLVVPVASIDADGDTLLYSASSSNPLIPVQVRMGNPMMKMVVSYEQVRTGTMELLLFRDFTPMTAGYIGGLTQKGFYNGRKIFRIENSLFQTGSPTDNSQGGASFKFDNEYQLPLIFSGGGQLAMANAGFTGSFKSTNGSQFFLTNGEARGFDFNHTIFGQLVRGYQTYANIINTPKMIGSPTAPEDPVTMTSVTIEPNNTDAYLIVAASGTGSTNIVVTVSDANCLCGGTTITTGTFVVQSQLDFYNDPPILKPVQNVVGSGSTARFTIVPQDLEFDYLQIAGSPADFPARATYSAKDFGRKIKATATPSSYRGPVNTGFAVQQVGQTSRGSVASPYDIKTAVAGLGDKTIVAEPVILTGTVGQALNTAVATFKDKDSSGIATQFTATINWGDDTVTGSTITPIASTDKPAFEVTGTHSYAAPGVYPVVVKIVGNLGATQEVFGSAHISAIGLRVAGLNVVANKGKLFNTVVGFIEDVDTVTEAIDYLATVTFGDGTQAEAVVTGSSGRFDVIAELQNYKNDGPYTTKIEVTKALQTVTSYGRVEVSGIKDRTLPPFKQGSLSAYFTTYALVANNTKTFLEGDLVVLNTGNRGISKSKLRFHLSDNKILEEGDTALFLADGTKTLVPPPFSANYKGYSFPLRTGTGYNKRVRFPDGVNVTGKYLIVSYVYDDPVNNLALRNRYVAVGL